MQESRAVSSSEAGAGPRAHAIATAINVVLIDNHQIVRRGIRELLSTVADINVVGEAPNGKHARGLISTLLPDVVVIDMHLGHGEPSGIEVCGDIRSAHPEVVCLMLTSIADPGACTAAIAAGASGYLLKQLRGSELVDSIRLVAAGATVVPPLLVAEVIGRLRGEGSEHLGELTKHRTAPMSTRVQRVEPLPWNV